MPTWDGLNCLMPGFLHMTPELLKTNNPRVLPQQSISSVIYVDDLETFVDHHARSHPGDLA